MIALLFIFAADPLELSAFGDPRFGMEGGVRTVISAHRALMLHDDFLAARFPLDDHKLGERVLGIAGRTLKLAFIDVPLAIMATTFAHELFGHGARGREAGQWPTYAFALPIPYSWFEPNGLRFTGVTYNAQVGQNERDLATIAGGLEANYAAAHWALVDSLKAGGRMRYSDALLYAVSKLPYLPRLLFGGVLPQNGEPDDVSSYLVGLTRRFGLFDDGQVEIQRERLRWASVIGLADPVFIATLWQIAAGHLYGGARRLGLWSFRVGDFDVLPTTRFNLTPNGAEHYLDVFLRKDGFVLGVYVRGASAGAAFAGGVGARLYELTLTEWLSLGGELDLYAAPQVVLGARNVFDRRIVLGVSYAVSADVRLYGPLRLSGRLGYKTAGHVFAQPFAEGVHGYFGVSLRL